MITKEMFHQADKALNALKTHIKLNAPIFTMKNMENIARHAGLGEETRKNLLSQMSDYYDEWLVRDEDQPLCEVCGEPLKIEDENVGFTAPNPVKIIFHGVCPTCGVIL